MTGKWRCIISIRMWILFIVELEALHGSEALHTMKNIIFTVGYSLAHGNGVQQSGRQFWLWNLDSNLSMYRWLVVEPWRTFQSHHFFRITIYILRLVRVYIVAWCYKHFPGGTCGKESACKCRRHRDTWV